MPQPPDAYRPLADFAAPARPRAELWRTLAGLVLIGALYVALIFGAVELAGRIFGAQGSGWLVNTMGDASTPAGLVLMLASFLTMAVAVVITARVLHGRGLASLLGHGWLRAALTVAVPLIALSILLLPLALLDPKVSAATPLTRLFAWLPLALPFLVVQIGAEELLFRGYLQQQLAARTKARWLWMGVPALLFGVLHYAPATYGVMAFWPVLWATAFGCLAADLTARTGNIGAALGFHFANNVSAMLLLGVQDKMDGLALYSLAIDPSDPAQLAPYMATDALSMLISWLLARLALRV